MTGKSFLCGQLARLAFLDAGHEGLQAMLAVCFAVRNRVRAGMWNSDWASVLSHHADYSYTLDPYPNTVPDPRNYTFNQLLQQVDQIFDGSLEDSVTVASDPISNYIRVGGARTGDAAISPSAPVVLYYAKSGAITNPWFEQNICNSPQHKMIASVGTMFFWS